MLTWFTTSVMLTRINSCLNKVLTCTCS